MKEDEATAKNFSCRENNLAGVRGNLKITGFSVTERCRLPPDKHQLLTPEPHCTLQQELASSHSQIPAWLQGMGLTFLPQLFWQ